MAKRKKFNQDRVKAKGWVGCNQFSGNIGRWLPEVVYNGYTGTFGPTKHLNTSGSDAFLCEITIKVIKDSRGRYIKRKPKKETP